MPRQWWQWSVQAAAASVDCSDDGAFAWTMSTVCLGGGGVMCGAAVTVACAGGGWQMVTAAGVSAVCGNGSAHPWTASMVCCDRGGGGVHGRWAAAVD